MPRNAPLPVGTQVSTRIAVRREREPGLRPAGAVAVVAGANPARPGSCRIRFPDGEEVTLARRDLAILAHAQREGMAAHWRPPPEADLRRYVILRCVVGSRAYGLEQEGSDTDRRGIYLPPADLHWSLGGVSEQLEDAETQETYWELPKFLALALRANPNILECLYTPSVEMATPLAEELLGMRAIFLSRYVYQTYNGYVMSQFRKLETDLRVPGEIRWKHAMHLIRLLLSDVQVLRDGFVPVRVEEHRDRLLAVRRGETPWVEVDAWRLRLHREFDAAYAVTRLPERPDYAAADAFLIRARRSMV